MYVAKRINELTDMLYEKKCFKTLGGGHYMLLSSIASMLFDHLVYFKSLPELIRRHDELVEELMETIEAERKPKYLKITEILKKAPEEVTIGDILKLMWMLESKIMKRCEEEIRERAEAEEEEAEEEAGEE